MAKNRELQPITLEECRIIFRNFSGLEGKFNPPGNRNFNVLLDEDIAENMARDGWNIKYLKPREEGDQPQAMVNVTVSFDKGRPPDVWMVSSLGKTKLPEEMVGVLDWADLVQTDIIIRPYQWEVNGKTGVKAYLKSIYAIIQEDELELKYRDVPDTAQNVLEYEPTEVLAIESGNA